MGIIKTAVKRRVTVMMLFTCIVMLGLVAFSRIGLDLMPDMEIPVALVMTTYSGAGSEEVETIVTKTIETAVASVEGVQDIVSMSSTGMSLVMVQYDWGTNLDMASIDLREQVDLMKAYLPDGVDSPMVMKMNMNQMPILVLAVSSDTGLAQLKQTVDDDIVPLLERQSGVAAVTVGGGYEEQVNIIVDPQVLENYNLSLGAIVGAVSANNVNMAAGQVVDGGKNMTIRLMGKFTQLSDIENVDVTLPAGSVVKLKDLARVELAQEGESIEVSQNGQECMYLSITKQSDANTVSTADNLLEVCRGLERSLPNNVHMVAVMNQAEMIQMSIDSLVNSLLLGSLLAVLVLFIFLRSVRSTLVIAISIPISLIATCMLMYFNGMTFNLLTLGGMALGAGMMVDSSVVILENIQRLRTAGMSGPEAAVKGASQMVLAVVSSTLTTVAVFLPISFTEGMASVMFTDLALTITFAMLASLFSAIVLVPMLCSNLLRPEASYSTEGGGLKAAIGHMQNRVAGWFEKLSELYRAALVHCLRHQKTTVLAVAGMLVVSCLMLATVGFEFMPSTASGQMTINLTLEDGTAKAETAKAAARAEKMIVDTVGADMDNMLVICGGSAGSMTGGSENEAQFMLSLVEEKRRGWDIDKLADELRTKLSDIAGAEISVNVGDMMSMSMSSGSGGATLNIYGEDLEVLRSLADRTADIMKTMPAAREVETSLDDALPELQLEINANKAAQLGMTVPQVASGVSAYINGVTATRFTREGGTEIDVKVMVPELYQENLDLILNQRLVSPMGAVYRLGDVVEVRQGAGPVSINRENQERYVSVSCSLVGQDLSSFTRELNERLAAELVLPQGYRLSDEGSYQQMIEAFASLLLALLLGCALIYMIMAALYESFSQPFIIFLTVPTGFIGAFFGLFVTRHALDVTGMIGLIMLVGIVVNNGIVLVDSINQLRRDEGLSLYKAILTAGPLRLRPVLMTALTTILSMLPMAFFSSNGAQMAAGMAIVVSFGLSVSTFLTLLFVPVMYSLFDRLAARFGRRGGGAAGSLRSDTADAAELV